MNITKGKWYAVENDYYIDIKVDGNPIAQVTENEFADTDKDVMRANAKLMECAPEMYKFLDDLANGRGTDYPIEQLLAKARGDNA